MAGRFTSSSGYPPRTIPAAGEPGSAFVVDAAEDAAMEYEITLTVPTKPDSGQLTDRPSPINVHRDVSWNRHREQKGLLIPEEE
jgi:hypothetical protein